MEHFFPLLQSLAECGREVLLCGDWNIAHKEIDLKNWRSNQKNSGFLPEERAARAIRFDRDDLTRADLTTRATAINSLISSRVLNPNEGRAWLGLEAREGGEEFLNPNISASAPPAEPAKKEPTVATE